MVSGRSEFCTRSCRIPNVAKAVTITVQGVLLLRTLKTPQQQPDPIGVLGIPYPMHNRLTWPCLNLEHARYGQQGTQLGFYGLKRTCTNYGNSQAPMRATVDRHLQEFQLKLNEFVDH